MAYTNVVKGWDEIVTKKFSPPTGPAEPLARSVLAQELDRLALGDNGIGNPEGLDMLENMENMKSSLSRWEALERKWSDRYERSEWESASLRQSLAETQQELASLKAETKQGMASLKAETKQGMASLEQGLAETKQESASFKAETKQESASFKAET